MDSSFRLQGTQRKELYTCAQVNSLNIKMHVLHLTFHGKAQNVHQQALHGELNRRHVSAGHCQQHMRHDCASQRNEMRMRGPQRVARDPCRTMLSDELFGRLNNLTAAVVAAELASTVHHLRVAAVVALHELGCFQAIVVARPSLTRARFRMTALWYSHDFSFLMSIKSNR